MRKVSILYLVGSTLLGALATMLYINYSGKNTLQNSSINSSISNSTSKLSAEAAPMQVTKYCDYNFHRLKGYKYIKPLLDGEPECESNNLFSLKEEITTYIESIKTKGSMNYCSVFFKNLSNSEWMVINPSQGYHPGSLIKVAVLLTYLRMAETNQDILNTQVEYTKDNTKYPDVNYKSDTIILGNRYKVRDLLYFMIANSDNRSTVVLENYMDLGTFKRTFSDLGLQELSFSDTSYRINAKLYTNFFSVIYNSGLVSTKSSEYAASMLTESTFRDGIVKLLPPELKVAHKFGEWGNGSEKELHESGIVYLDNTPYIITVMTKGNNWDNLSEVISHISKMVYDKVTMPKKPV